MAEIRERIAIHKHFLIIDSPISFRLIANNGTDEVYRMAGAWRIDLWKLLSKDYFKQYPVFELELVYDDTNLGDNVIQVRQSDIDLGSGIAGVNGQEVYVTNLSDLNIPKKKLVTIKLNGVDELIEYLNQNCQLEKTNYYKEYILDSDMIYFHLLATSGGSTIPNYEIYNNYIYWSSPSSNLGGFVYSLRFEDKPSNDYIQFGARYLKESDGSYANTLGKFYRDNRENPQVEILKFIYE